MTIALKRLHFFSHHGLYPEEKKTGNEFEVNVSVSFKPGKEAVKTLTQTVNYEKLYELVSSVMNTPHQLLETVATEIAGKIHDAFPFVLSIDIEITKLHLPIEKFLGTASAKYSANY